jgi:predicted transcriptional regulator
MSVTLTRSADSFQSTAEYDSIGTGISILPTLKYNTTMKAISIKLPDPLFHDLAQAALARASSQSEIMRNALTAYLKQDAKPPVASCMDRASRWAGIMQGPADLSTNPDHLRGFGE